MTKQTKQDVERAFKADLRALLKKWGAELEVVWDVPEVEVCIPAVFNDAHEVVRESAIFTLGRYIHCDIR